ncbi:hypothetical protein WAE61_03800 [Comamonadaceae bacterium PP-2]
MSQTSGDYAEYQIEIPPSFVALYSDAQQRLLVPLAQLRLRYEVCEDLAQHLAGPAQSMLDAVPDSSPSTGIDILRRILKGLLSGESGIDSKEACWVVHRLAEVLDWPTLHEDEIRSCSQEE